MKYIFVLIFINLISLAQDRLGQYKFNFDRVYAESKEVSEFLLKNCSPPKCHIIGLGRSPTAIASFLDAINPELITNLPLSNFRSGVDKGHFLARKIRQKKVFSHFDRILKDKLKRFESFIILDYSVSGQSVFAVNSYLDKYLEENFPNKKTSSVIFSHVKNNKDILKNANRYKVKYRPTLINLQNNYPELYEVMNYSLTDEIAEYKQFYIEHFPAAEKNESTARKVYLYDIKNKIKSDNSLAPFAAHLCMKMFK